MPNGRSVYSSKYGYYEPEENAEQWRALAEYCLDRGLYPIKSWHYFFGGDDEYITHGSWLNSTHPANAEIECYGILHSSYNVSAWNRADCMIAAVLALREGE